MGGGSPKGKKKPTVSERDAALLAAKKTAGDARALAGQSDWLKRARRRGSLFGGPESGAVAPNTLGGGVTRLGGGAAA